MTPIVYLLTVGQKNGTDKMMNDKTELVKEAKNDKASRCWSAYQKKIRQNAIRRNATQPLLRAIYRLYLLLGNPLNRR